MNIDILIAKEAWIKLAIFIGLLIIMFTAEHFFSRRKPENMFKRWSSNLGVIISSTILTRLIFPIAGVAAAYWADKNVFGLFHLLQWNSLLEVFLVLVLMDMAIYWQHRFFHILPWLWRIHRVHHTDIGFDTSLGIRLHPFEITLSQAYKLFCILLLGASPIAVLIYECLLMSFTLLTHGNVRLPTKFDAALRIVFVTPDYHRVHHSVYREETESNYGNILSLWDRLFASYRAQPRDGHEAMQIGLPQFRSAQSQGLIALLVLPFRQRDPENKHA